MNNIFVSLLPCSIQTEHGVLCLWNASGYLQGYREDVTPVPPVPFHRTMETLQEYQCFSWTIRVFLFSDTIPYIEL